MRLDPRIARERRANGALRLGLYDVLDAVLIHERPAEDDEPCLDEPVHEGRVRRPVGLLFQRARRVPQESER